MKKQVDKKNNWEKIFLDCFKSEVAALPEPVTDEDTAALEMLGVMVRSGKHSKTLIAAPTFAASEQLTHELMLWNAALKMDYTFCLLPEGAWRDAVTLENEAPRAEALAKALAPNPPDCFIGSILAFLSPTPDPKIFRGSEIALRKNDVVSMEKLLRQLVELGYDDEPEAVTVGEFSRRGGILDIYSPGMKYPVRLEFFGDQIESIREYAPDSGRSIREIQFCKILVRSGCGCPPEGMDYPDFSAYCRERSLMVWSPAECESNLLRYGGPRAAEHWKSFQEKNVPVIPLRQEIEAVEAGKNPDARRCVGVAPALRETAHANPDTVVELSRKLAFDFVQNLLDDGWKIVLASGSDSDRGHIADWLHENGLEHHSSVSVADFPIPCGVMFPNRKIVFLTERELFSACLRGKDRVRHEEDLEEETERVSAKELESMADIEVGDLTVHLNYGLCRFKGIKTVRTAASSVESLELEFADDATVYVPVWQAHLLSRYVGAHAKGSAVLSKLGSSRWVKAREEAALSAKNLACEMLRMQAIRRSSPGEPFPTDGFEQKLFEDSFPYDETDGQQKAIDEIKRDMESERPMDRLLCGDVGYGKTEVAMRAAFKAAVSGKQTAILVPTTVLAQQHFYSFQERFAEYPIVIETISRLKTPKEKRDIIARINAGSVDIVIGTHAMLSSEIKFNNLGLVIIDEEQRFGVEHKEKLKSIRSTVDVLTMTATPIPRTLHMSMSGLRDLSAITTAPVKRLPVHTIVAQSEPSLVAAAISRELGRGGQLFYLHNRVNSIDKAALRVKALAPDARIAIAHGQMKGSELEEIMGRFIEGKIDILVCTTIIESGIDIPNANTIIIDRADTFGLAELHQLRGRVGRWNRQAYAYLLLPPDGVMTTDARRRMAAIRRYTHLGSGFQLAIRDLEIRGAGNIIGAEQSGHVDAIGFHLYCQLLKEISNTLRGVTNPKLIDCELNLDFLEFALECRKSHIPAGIPPDYIEDERLRLEAYRRLAFLTEPSALADYESELRDRFGKLPQPAENFLATVRLRIYAAKSGFHAFSCRDGKVFLEKGNDIYRRNGVIPKIDNTRPPQDRLRLLEELIEGIFAENSIKK